MLNEYHLIFVIISCANKMDGVYPLLHMFFLFNLGHGKLFYQFLLYNIAYYY